VRDQYFEGVAFTVAGIREQLTPKSAARLSVSGGAWVAGSLPEIPKAKIRPIVIADFTRWRSVLSASRHSVYREMKMLVSDIF
jgi:hypothetical protein